MWCVPIFLIKLLKSMASFNPKRPSEWIVHQKRKLLKLLITIQLVSLAVTGGDSVGECGRLSLSSRPFRRTAIAYSYTQLFIVFNEVRSFKLNQLLKRFSVLCRWWYCERCWQNAGNSNRQFTIIISPAAMYHCKYLRVFICLRVHPPGQR